MAVFCPDCGAECRPAHTRDGTRVMIEEREEMSGEGRYLEPGDGYIVALAPEDPQRGYVDHTKWCPALIGYSY